VAVFLVVFSAVFFVVFLAVFFLAFAVAVVIDVTERSVTTARRAAKSRRSRMCIESP
jgi:hypothetical protein